MPPKITRIPTPVWEEPEGVLDWIDWIRDPAPDWILRDSVRLREFLEAAANFRAREIEVEVQQLNLEKERIQTMLKFYQQ
ncbi:MAG: hypothetical protein EHM41_17970 [Chloroflexi bacterium]|nr:MAG: hypothetical protein EHM41_17970 [Chloroflexota bacterium]